MIGDNNAVLTAEELAREQLMGNLVTAAMKQMRSVDIPWASLPKHKQEQMIAEVRKDVWYAVSDAVDLISSDARTRFRAGVESVTFKDGVKAVLTMKNTEASHELADSAGGSVLIVIENPDRYTSGEEGMPEAEDDQRSLA